MQMIIPEDDNYVVSMELHITFERGITSNTFMSAKFEIVFVNAQGRCVKGYNPRIMIYPSKEIFLFGFALPKLYSFIAKTR